MPRAYCNQCAEIKLRAERRAGEMLGEMDREKPGEYKKFHDVTFYPKPLHDERVYLKDLGITEIQSHRWQTEWLCSRCHPSPGG